MNIKSRIMAISIVTALTLTFTVNSFAAATNQFTDLTNVAAKEKILVLQEKGYVVGVGNHRFAPDAKITAAESIQLIVNALKLNLDFVKFAKEPKATDYFTKANNDAWYAHALIVAAVNGIELPADLDLDKKWTREEFTHNLIQAMERHYNLPMLNLVPTKISDQEQLTIIYDGSIQRALVYGVVKLDAEGRFNPKGEITRAEAAEQIYNALEYINAHPAPTIDLDKTEN